MDGISWPLVGAFLALLVLILPFLVIKPDLNLPVLEQTSSLHIEGFYDVESNPTEKFRWTTEHATLYLPSTRLSRKLHLEVRAAYASASLTPRLSIKYGDQTVYDAPVTDNWTRLDLNLAPRIAFTSQNLELTVASPRPPNSDDHRVLGIAVRQANLETGRIPSLALIGISLLIGLSIGGLARLVGLSRVVAVGLVGLPWAGLNLYWWLAPFEANPNQGWLVLALSCLPLLAFLKKEWRSTTWLVVGLIVVINVLAYSATLGFGFYWDDYHIARPWSFGETLQTFVGTWDPFRLEVPYYRPLTVLSFALDWRIWHYNLGGYHLTNLILYVISALGVYLLLKRIGFSQLYATAGSLLFSLLPPNAATVSWLSERSDTLAVIAMIGGLLALRRYRAGGGWRWLILANLALVVALLAKELGLVLPVLFVLDGYLLSEKPFPAWPSSSHRVNLALVYGGPFVLVGVYIILRRVWLGADSGSLEGTLNPARFGNIVYNSFFGIDRLFGYWIAPWFAILLVGLFVAGVILKNRLGQTWRIMTFGLGWMLVACVPLVPLKYDITPRLFYLADVGYVIILMGGLYLGLEGLKLARSRPYFGPALILIVVLLLVPSLPAQQYNECARDFYAPNAVGTLRWDQWIYRQANWKAALPADHFALVTDKLRSNGLINKYSPAPLYPPPYQCVYRVDNY